MTIQEAITERIARFDRLWLQAVGYTFQDEPEVEEKRYNKEMAEWQPKADDAAKKHGFGDFDAYVTYVREDNDRIEELEDIWGQEPVTPTPLIKYEMSVIDESQRIAEFIEAKAEEKHLTPKEAWDLYAKKDDDTYVSCWDFVDNIKADGYTGWDDGHSGNSGSAAVLFVRTLIFDRDLFPYLHGALSTLVGDKGYHDDRSDVKAYIEAHKKNEE